MLTIPEIAAQLIDKTLSNLGDNNVRTLFLVGSKSVGKSTLLYYFLDKTDVPRETPVLEYSFGRKSHQKQGIDKTICHIWEYGGKLETLSNVLALIPIRGAFFYSVMIDLSKIKNIWETLETCVLAMNDTYSAAQKPELIIIGGKYDIFKNYDSEIKKAVYVTLRSFALLNNAHLMVYSLKEPQLLRRGKDMLLNIGFGNGVPIPHKEKNTNIAKPLFVPKGADSWESIGVAPCTQEQVKTRHLSRIPLNVNVSNISTASQHHCQPEPTLDALLTTKYNELRNIDQIDISVDYLLSINK